MKLSHKTLLGYIGEIEGISLRKDGDSVSVYLHFADSYYQILKDYSPSGAASVSRSEIADILTSSPVLSPPC
jgi:hypothetical protein